MTDPDERGDGMTTLRELLNKGTRLGLTEDEVQDIESWAYGEERECERCGGDGGWLEYDSNPSRIHEQDPLRRGDCAACFGTGKTRELDLAFRVYDRVVVCQRDDHGDDECWIDAIRQELGEG